MKIDLENDLEIPGKTWSETPLGEWEPWNTPETIFMVPKIPHHGVIFTMFEIPLEQFWRCCRSL